MFRKIIVLPIDDASQCLTAQTQERLQGQQETAATSPQRRGRSDVDVDAAQTKQKPPLRSPQVTDADIELCYPRLASVACIQSGNGDRHVHNAGVTSCRWSSAARPEAIRARTLTPETNGAYSMMKVSVTAVETVDAFPVRQVSDVTSTKTGNRRPNNVRISPALYSRLL